MRICRPDPVRSLEGKEAPLKPGETRTMSWEEDEYIEIENANGRRQFIRNPFYRGKDPMKEIYWKNKNADGTWGFSHNPFFKPQGINYSNTWQKFNQNNDMPWLFQPEVDPVMQ